MNNTVQTTSDHSPGMASASLILGLFSIIMVATGFSFIIGSVGIILALMSRGRGPLIGKARTGLITSLVGIVGGIAVTLIAFFSLFSGNLQQTLDRMDSLYETFINEGTLDQTDIDKLLTDPNDTDKVNTDPSDTDNINTDPSDTGSANGQTALGITNTFEEEVGA